MKKLMVTATLLFCTGVLLAGNMEQTSARLYKKQGEWLKSWQFYNESLRKDPSNVEAFFERGELLKDIASDSAKLDIAKQIVGNIPNPQDSLYALMLADFHTAQVPQKPEDEGVVKKLKKKIDQDLQDRWNYFYFEAVQKDSAYTKAMTEKITSPDPKDYLRNALMDLDKAIKMLPDKWNAYGLKAQVAGKLEDRKLSLEYWQEALTHINASDMQKKEAEAYKQAVDVIRGNLLEHYYNLDKFRDAIAMADTILKQDPASIDALQFKAFSMARLAADTALPEAERNKIKSDAIAALDQAKKVRPDEPVIMYYIGQFHLQLGDTAAAIAAYDDLLKVDPKDKDVMFILGVLYLEGGSYVNTEKARDTFAKIVELYPEHGPSWLNYGIAMIRLGQNAKGKEYIEKGKALGAER